MELHEYLEQKAQFEKEIRKNGKKMLIPLFEELIGDGTVISGVKWTQHMDVFNDGDPLYFSVREHEFYLNVPPPTVITCQKYNCAVSWRVEDKPKFCADCGTVVPDAPEEVIVDAYSPWKEHQELIPLQERIQKFNKIFGKLDSVLETVFGDPAEVHVYDVGDGLEWEIDEDFEPPY